MPKLSREDREAIVSRLVFALRFRVQQLQWKRGTEADTRIAAERIVDYLLLSNVQLSIGEPRSGHSTPELRSD